MPVLKVYKNGSWEELGGTSPMDGGNADTLDGKHASDFALALDANKFEEYVNDGFEHLHNQIGDDTVEKQIENALANFSSGKTLTEHLTEEDMILSSRQYGDTLPPAGNPGRLFFLRVSD